MSCQKLGGVPAFQDQKLNGCMFLRFLYGSLIHQVLIKWLYAIVWYDMTMKLENIGTKNSKWSGKIARYDINHRWMQKPSPTNGKGKFSQVHLLWEQMHSQIKVTTQKHTQTETKTDILTLWPQLSSSKKKVDVFWCFNPNCHGLLGPRFKVPTLNLTQYFNHFQILFLQRLRYIYKGLESKIWGP